MHVRVRVYVCERVRVHVCMAVHMQVDVERAELQVLSGLAPEDWARVRQVGGRVGACAAGGWVGGCGQVRRLVRRGDTGWARGICRGDSDGEGGGKGRGDAADTAPVGS